MLKKLLALDSSTRLFLLGVTLCSFFISAEYGITRPASNAIFVTNFGVDLFPYAWLATLPLNLAIVFLYNRFLPKIGCQKTFLGVVSLVILVHAISGFLIPYYPSLSFFHYIWKDIYILLMFKQLWSLIHSTINTQNAKYVYGFLFGIGAMGSVAGSLVPSFLAVKLGSEKLFFFAIPIYLLIYFFYSFAYKKSKVEIPATTFEKTSPFKLIANSRFLTYVLLVVVFMQISIAFGDYLFNAYLENHIPTKDLRTEYCGRMISLINTISMGFQLLGGFFAIHFLGMKNAHRLVPLYLLLNVGIFFFFPTFAVVSYLFVAIKAMDFSFFSVIREMLYIPLKPDEKFRAKAVIDVFAYRSAKALASFLLLFLQFVTASKPLYLVGVLSVITFMLWSFVVYLMFRKQSELVFAK